MGRLLSGGRGAHAGFLMLTFLGVLVAPWATLAALIRQREAFARRRSGSHSNAASSSVTRSTRGCAWGEDGAE
jgi:hypothetical protein